MNSSNRNFNPVRLTKTETIIVKVLCLLLAVSVLSSCSAQKQERDWNDMYEVRSYQIETVTNEIITTVFISKFTETNKVLSTKMSVVNDDSGYVWDYIDEKNVSKNVNGNVIEFQCVDGSCELDK